MSLELKKAIDDLGTAFAEFKATNDQRLEALKKGLPTADFDEKLQKMNGRLSDLDNLKQQIEALEAKANRPGAGGEASTSKEEADYKQAFSKFMRKGDETELALKAINVTTPADGGFAVPVEVDRNIIQLERGLVPMRSVCNVITVGTESWSRLINKGGASSGWVGETDARSETDTPTMATVAPFFGEVYAEPHATQKSLDDVFFNVEAWLADEVAIEFAEQENAAFTGGDGVKKPKGFLAYPNAATEDAARALGTLQFVNSGNAATIPNADCLITLTYKLKQGYRRNASWMLNPTTMLPLRLLKDAEGNYLWRPGLDAGEPSTLLSKPVIENDDMPSVAANALAIGFGDWKRGYTIADRVGVRVLRDPYTRKPYVKFYTTKRVGGGVMDSNAIKLLKIAA